MLSEATKDRVRVHLGVPVDGVAYNARTTGYRYFINEGRIGQLEYRMNNLKPINEASVTGQAIGDARFYGQPAPGDVVYLTFGSGSPTLPNLGPAPTTVDRSGSVAQANTSYVLFPANSAREYWRIQNHSHGKLWINPTGAPASVYGVGCIEVPPYGFYQLSQDGGSAITIAADNAGSAYSALESDDTTTASVPIVGYPLHSGNTLAYVVGIQDVQSASPLFNIAQNLASAFNQTFGGQGYQATTASPLSVTGIGATPVFGQFIILANSSAAFTFSTGFIGKTNFVVTTQGTQPSPQFFNPATGQMLNGYLPILDYLEGQTVSVDQFAAYDSADVVKFTPNELGRRAELYRFWQNRLADYFGVAVYPMGRPVRSSGGLSI